MSSDTDTDRPVKHFTDITFSAAVLEPLCRYELIAYVRVIVATSQLVFIMFMITICHNTYTHIHIIWH